MASQYNENFGTIIILNGPSASGKSTLQKKIQEHFDSPYLSVGIDGFFDQLLPDYYGIGEIHPKGNFKEEDIRYVETLEVEGSKAVKLFIGPIGQKVIKGMHDAFASYAKNGNNLVVDYILYEKSWFKHLVKSLKGIKTYYIGIDYPIEEIEKREKNRATSPVGHARSHYREVHTYSNYDLLFNDPAADAENMALKLKEHILNNPYPNSFMNYETKLLD